MKIYRVMFFIGITILLMACTLPFNKHTSGSGNVITEKRVVGEFSSLDLIPGFS